MKIPFADIKRQYHNIKNDINNAIEEVLNDTAFIRGKYVNRFEKNFCSMYGVGNSVGVGNGTDAIYLALRALEVGPGDEVITVCNSWISTSEVVSQVGASVKFVDIESDNYNIDVDLIEEKITKKTKVIIPVHLYGQPIKNFEKLIKIANKHSLYIIEDCAHAVFAKYKDQYLGTFGDFGTISFYPGKNLGAYGDAGIVISNNDNLARKVRMLANHGQEKKHTHIYEGVNSRMDGIQGNILNTKLNYILDWNQKRREIAKTYEEKLSNIDEIITPKVDIDSTHVFHLYVVRAEKRDKLKIFLESKGIGTAIHYPTILPMLDCYHHLNYSINDFPIGNKLSSEILSIPMFPEMTSEEINYVCQAIRDFYL